MPNATVLYRYKNRYGVTRSGAVLAADPFCQDENETLKAVPCAVTDDGHGGDAAISALGFVLDIGEPEKYLPVFKALVGGEYATAVQEAEKLELLK